MGISRLEIFYDPLEFHFVPRKFSYLGKFLCSNFSQEHQAQKNYLNKMYLCIRYGWKQFL